MNVSAPICRAAAAILLSGVIAVGAHAQGFAGMGTSADGFALPRPGAEFAFPDDHGPHEAFRIEWWYLTANLRAEDGTDYGLQWTLFRSALSPETGKGWDSNQFWMGHAAVTAPDAHYSAERFARGGIGQAGVRSDPFAAWIDDWQMTGIEAGRLTAAAADFAYDMTIAAQGPFVPQGESGYSVKSQAGQASHYYSQPFYRIEGTLILPGGPVKVAGHAWLDREWSSQPLTEDQTGWDWVSLHLDTGEKLMGYRLRSALDPAYTVATWIDPDGTPTPYRAGVLTMTPTAITEVRDREIPTEWRLTLPGRGLDISVAALNPQAWMDTAIAYWEGPVRVTGSHDGVGYLEMTGYD
ncbi:MAG: lipocalin-like domain-containing protein [Rhodobacter sp.]|nr:lipocalin-like domain-containing protein [Rhodobacter sp.]